MLITGIGIGASLTKRQKVSTVLNFLRDKTGSL